MVSARFDKVLDYIDHELSSVLKVFLTGGAAGVDLLTARRVLGLDRPDSLDTPNPRPNWLVAVTLPFELPLFREDFDDDAEWAQLEELLAHPRARQIVLPGLRAQPARPAGLAPGIDPLSRANKVDEWKDFRRRHYEQAGLWIVDNANILLAVMSETEAADKIGGTARIVAFRRGGRPDAVANAVIAASDAPLAPRPPLVRPPQQYVWLLDPAAKSADAKLPVNLLPPIVEPEATARAYQHPGIGADPGKREEHLEDSMAAPHTIRRLAAGSTPAVTAWPDESCPAAVIKGIRDAQRGVRASASAQSARAFKGLGWLFVFTVVAFEVYAKFWPTEPLALVPYVVLFAVAMGWYYFAQYRRWQPDTEDSRAIAELLRLQYAWWRAGIRRRVDHIHLQGADKDLARVRDAARNAITWAKLVARGQPARENWPEAWQASPADGQRPDWVGEQLGYFRKREREREKRATWINLLSWTLFVTSFVLATFLLAWLACEPLRDEIDRGVEWVAAYGRCAIAFVMMIGGALAVVAWLLRLRFADHERPQAIFTGLTTFVAAFGLAVGLRMGGELLAGLSHHDPQHDGNHDMRYLTIIMIVALPAIAGAMRFVSEKLAYEAEALSYREALRWFEHADELLTAQPPGRGSKTADDSARTIVEQLGRLALSENEAWLKSRRERPLSPVIGG